MSSELECLGNPEECVGPVELRGAPDGRSWPRCVFHDQQRWDSYNDPNSIERYANSDVPPSWFDPTLAGERWDDDY